MTVSEHDDLVAETIAWAIDELASMRATIADLGKREIALLQQQEENQHE